MSVSNNKYQEDKIMSVLDTVYSVIDATEMPYVIMILVSSIIGMIWAYIQSRAVTSIEVKSTFEMSHGDDENDSLTVSKPINAVALIDIGNKIAEGANAFLYAEYKIMAIFMCLFGTIIYVIVDVLGARSYSNTKFIPYATIAFLIGAMTSILCGFIGMRIAVIANYRTTFKAAESLEAAFKVAYRAGCVMGFGMVSLSLFVLALLMLIYLYAYRPEFGDKADHSYENIMDLIAGYGLGGSSMALFGRVGGGIYTKAADVGADLVGKVEEGLAEDSPRNPATIADNVGDNVGDIAGMGSDLFGSFAESTCAALVLITSNPLLFTNENRKVLWYPLMISAVGIKASLITSIIGVYFQKVNDFSKIQKALNNQLLISTIIMLIGLWILTPYNIPVYWEYVDAENMLREAHWYYPAICASMGLISGFLIGISTDYYTSNYHRPVVEMAEKCSSGPAINVIYGLALGYVSTIIPVILLSLTVIVCVNMLGMLGVALAAIGMLSTLAIGLAIDAYGPISDNAGGIAEMCELPQEVRDRTDALDAAGNTTAAIGKGFAIGSAALVSLSLYGAFVARAIASRENPLKSVEINNGWIFGSLLFGAMLPYWFSAMTMKSVGSAASQMVDEVRRQFKDPDVRNGKVEPDYKKCIEVSTKASLQEMIAPGVLVMLTPIFFGVLFGTRIVAGILPGALLSGIQLAISMSNTGGAWDNAKK